MNNRYLGLDVSPLRIGWAVISDEFLDHGVIIFDKDEWVTPGMRSDALEDLSDKYPRIDIVALEAVFVGPNKIGSIRAAMALGQVESICDYLWPDANQKILTATQWRSACELPMSGKAGVKSWAIATCIEAGVHAPQNQDACDAIAIATAIMVRADG